MKNHIKDIISDTFQKTIGAKGEYSSLKEKTALLFKDEINIKFCQLTINNINHLIKNGEKIWKDPLGSDTRIYDFHKQYPSVLEIIDVKKEIERIQLYLGTKIKSWTLMANKVITIKNNLGSGAGMHRDSPFRHQIKIIWYLNDVSKDNGAFSYIKGSHYRSVYNEKPWEFNSRINTDINKFTSVYASAGAKLVCDTKCVHLGKPLIKGERYALMLYTFESPTGVNSLFDKLGFSH